MSRITKWKFEKTKVKVVFRLQFHATNIPQAGWDKLFITFIPVDSGKATAKTSKGNVRNGTCKWADPIYETTRLLQDSKTKQFDEKLYKLVVTMGSLRSSVLGEATVNLAHYADALKPYVVALPLQGCNVGSLLHVTVQLLTSKTGFREFEQQRELRERGLQSTLDASSARRISSSADAIHDQLDKASSRVEFKEELPPLEEEMRLNEDCADSAVSFDDSSNTSESLYAEKRDISSTHEIDSINSLQSGDLVGLSSSQIPQPEKGDPSNPILLPHGSNDWCHGWGSDYSADNDLVKAYEENSRLRGGLEAAESSIIELKQELGDLQIHADDIGTEAKKISQLLATEFSSGEQLEKEVSALRSECSKFKNDLELLKDSKLSTSVIIGETTKKDQIRCSEVLQNSLFKGLFDVEDLIRELQNKSFNGFNEKDFRPFNSDLEGLIGVLQDLRQGTEHAISAINLTGTKGNGETLLTEDQLISGSKLDADFYQPEGMLHSEKIPAPIFQQYDSTEAHNPMNENFFELLKELDESKAEREGLARKMGHMECYYEALVQELEETQRQMMGELQNLRNEHSTCLYTLSATKTELDKINQDTSKQMIRFAEEKCNLESLNKDLERRAVTAEAALKRVRLNYSIAANQLQKDLELLSSQVISMYETNEDLIKQAFSDSAPSSRLGCEEIIQNRKSEEKDFHDVDFHEGLKKQCIDGHIFSEDLKKSIFLQKAICQKAEEEIYEVHLVNVYLDVFSKALQETLLEGTANFRLREDLVDELKQQLQLSNKSKELLMLKLQTAVDEIHCMKECRDACDAKCNDLALQNKVLEANIQNSTLEICLLSQKITEYETLVKEFGGYKNKFEACIEEKLELVNSFQKERLENDALQNKICLLQKEMKAIQTELNELASVKENLQKTVDFVHDNMHDLLASSGTKHKGLFIWSQSIPEDIESKDLASMFLHLKEFQHSSFEKIFQLIEEKQVLVQERDTAQVSFRAAESDNLLMKDKFEHDVQNIMHKMDVSAVLVQRIQSEIEAIGNRLKISSAAEEDYAQNYWELLSNYDHLEVELQQLTSENKDLAKEIMALENVTEELGRCKLVAAALSEEKESLILNLKDKTEDSAKLAGELIILKSSFQSLHEEFQDERISRGRLESTVADLTTQLNVKQSELQHFNQQQAKFVDLKELVWNLEMENSRLKYSLLDSEEYLKTARDECSSFSSLNMKLSEMHEVLIAMDVRLTFTRTQSEAVIQELNQQLCYLDMYLVECQKKFLDVQKKLDCCLASEAHYAEENARLMESLNSLKSDLDASVAENKTLFDTNNVLKTEIERSEEGSRSMEGLSHVERSRHVLEVEKLENMLTKSVEVIDNMTFSKEEQEVQCLVFKAKLDELQPQIALLEEFKHELAVLQKKYSELFDANSVLKIEIEKSKERSKSMEGLFRIERSRHVLEVKNLENMLTKSEEVINSMTFSKEEQEVQCLIFKAKLDELQAQIALFEEFKHELALLQKKYSELFDTNNVLKAEIEKNMERFKSMEGLSRAEKSRHVLEVEKLENMLTKSEEVMDNMTFLKEEQEVQCLVFKAKLDELQPQIALLEEFKHELAVLQKKYSELFDANSVLKIEIEKSKERSKSMEGLFRIERSRHVLEVKNLENMLTKSEEVINSMTFSKEEQEVQCLIFKAKLDELQAQIALFEEFKHELALLQKKYSELFDTNNVLKAEIEKNMERFKSMEGLSRAEKSRHVLEVEKLENMLTKSEEVMDNMTFLKEEQEVQCLVFKAKLDELQPQIALLEEFKHELAVLQKNYSELTHRFSEHVLKTEEFKNLSIHLKEHKDKADAECHQAHEKREPEGPPLAVQKSLTIAFIKEQYETKLQELKHQLSISKRQFEEMLLKFQDAVDEVENRKKSEATHLKRNEELGIRILELESELHSALSEKREILKASDLLKAEKECLLTSLQCCKEEKQELEVSLQNCNEEKSKIAVELTSVKEFLETSVSAVNNQMGYNDGLYAAEYKSDELVNSMIRQKNPISDSPTNGRTDNILPVKCSIDVPLDAPSDQDILQCCQEVNSIYSNRVNEADNSDVGVNMQTKQDVLVSRNVDRIPIQEDIVHDETKPLALVMENFKAQNLKSSIDHLNKELEKMKHDNLLLCQVDHHSDSNIRAMQRELVQLHKVNEELGSLFPLFNEFSSGNALERVLALEIELAEALQTKKKSNIHFQSSFLKQHSDEAAVFQSFRDINELIKDMLELKGKYASVDTELKELHDRYSQLSLQFAEVEGEKQKLIITLKNVRGPKKVPYLNRSSTAPYGDKL